MCVTDVGVAITFLRVVCKTITCASAFTEMAISFFLEILNLQVWILCVAGYAKDAIVGALSTGTQDYLACWTRTRHDFSLTFHSVQRARQPPSRRAVSGGSFTVAGGSSSFVSKVLGES